MKLFSALLIIGMLTGCKISSCYHLEMEPAFTEAPPKGYHIKEMAWQEQESDGINIIDIPFVYNEFDFCTYDIFYV